jgi:multidrug efflux pump subunit AcrA (membrane-fusion protein)
MESKEIDMDPEFTEQVARGVDALRSGRRATARRLFARAVREDQNNATAWLWLGCSVDDERQNQECMDRAHRLDRQRRHVAADAQIERPPAQPERIEAKAPSRRYAARQEARDPPPAHRHRWGLVATVVTVLAICAIVPFLLGRSAAAQAGTDDTTDGVSLEASGVIQGEEILLSSEYGRQVGDILVEEGQAVGLGQVLVQLDTELLDVQIDAAQAAVDLAKTGLAQADAGARTGQIAVAQAQLAQAQAARLVAGQAVSDTLALVEDPQEIRMQIAVLQAQIQAETHRLAERLALKDAAEIGKDQFEDAQDLIQDAGGSGVHRVPIPGTPGAIYEYTVPSLPLEAHLAPNYWWQAWVGVNATAAQKEGLEASLNQLYAQRQHPQQLEVQVDQALSALAQAEAQVAIAQAQVDALKAGASNEQIEALEARVEQAQAILDSLTSERARMAVRSPIDGVVVDCAVHQGEVAAPGATIATVADLKQVKLTVYVPETQIGRVNLGQAVQVSVDSFADRAFEGKVTHIADEAQFTPRNVATKEERVNLVFAVEISLPNEDGALKPGMPADAVFGE